MCEIETERCVNPVHYKGTSLYSSGHEYTDVIYVIFKCPSTVLKGYQTNSVLHKTCGILIDVLFFHDNFIKLYSTI